MAGAVPAVEYQEEGPGGVEEEGCAVAGRRGWCKQEREAVSLEAAAAEVELLEDRHPTLNFPTTVQRRQHCKKCRCLDNERIFQQMLVTSATGAVRNTILAQPYLQPEYDHYIPKVASRVWTLGTRNLKRTTGALHLEVF